MAKEKKKLPVVDSESVRDVYADTVVSTGFFNGTCVVTLGATRYVPERTNEAPQEGAVPSVYVTAKLAITPSAAVELVSILGNMFKTLSHAEKATQKTAGEMKPSETGSKH
ncbi:hypothetical protein A7A08_03160 [Methyloligella halotolerans]|uniref:Uncharacterized protein n=1 Tax=Methyloligella halotolerans TaxID=1177755 RepID=A0A1E2RV55_9HYPH|nr:hypothetical protein [Methyloligella halotolerans]ODA65929.1 hypothetical protein A7A08_03160 [Methyloligella halotolerans]